MDAPEASDMVASLRDLRAKRSDERTPDEQLAVNEFDKWYDRLIEHGQTHEFAECNAAITAHARLTHPVRGVTGPARMNVRKAFKKADRAYFKEQRRPTIRRVPRVRARRTIRTRSTRTTRVASATHGPPSPSGSSDPEPPPAVGGLLGSDGLDGYSVAIAIAAIVAETWGDLVSVGPGTAVQHSVVDDAAARRGL